MVIAHGDLLVLLQAAPFNAASGDAAHELVVVDGTHQHLEGLVHVGLRGGDILQNSLEEGRQVGAHGIGGIRGRAVAAGAEQHGAVQLLRRGVQVHEKLQHLVDDLVNPLVGAVDLVHHHNDPVAKLQSLGEDETGLGHGALGGVHQENHAVDHLQNALHLAAEVGVSWGIHNVDLGILVLNSCVFGQDGDAPLPLQVTGVHDPVHHLLIFPVYAALLEHLVHQRGFAVVDVGNDCNVSQFFILHILLISFYKARPDLGTSEFRPSISHTFFNYSLIFPVFQRKNPHLFMFSPFLIRQNAAFSRSYLFYQEFHLSAPHFSSLRTLTPSLPDVYNRGAAGEAAPAPHVPWQVTRPAGAAQEAFAYVPH